jgi:hypothetical protein
MSEAPDVFRIVEFSAGYRPVLILDLERIDKPDRRYVKVRDSFKFTPPTAKKVEAQQGGRFGGSRQVGESHENGTITAKLWVSGTDKDDCLTNTAALVEAINHASPGRFIEWLPGGASPSRTVYREIRGTASWSDEYSWPVFNGTDGMVVEITIPVEPRARLPHCDVGDPFTVDSTSDYALDGELVWTDGALTPGADVDSEARLLHTVRGHEWLEAQATRKYTPGATISGFKGGVLLRYSDDENYVECYVDDNGTNSRLRIDVVVAGSRTNRATTNLGGRVSNGTAFWVRGRVEGGDVYAEHFTSEPTPMGAPTTTRTYTLTGGEENLPAGPLGASWVPKHAAATLTNWVDEPFTRRNQTLPASVSWADAIPGDVDALCDLHVTTSGGSAAPVWAMFGWTPTPGTPLATAKVPFGILRAEAADTVSTWAATSDSDYRGGSGLQATASGAGTASAEWIVDPAVLAPDPFTLGELELDFWVRVEIAAALVSPKLALSAKPSAGTNFGAQRYTGLWGSQGKLLTKPSSGTRFRMVKLGSMTVLCDPLRPVLWRFRLDGSWAAASSGIFGVDDLYIVPAGSMVAGPTGRALDANYPKFIASTNQTTKIIRSDQSGLAASPPANPSPDSGLGGPGLLEPPAGHLDTLLVLSSLIPDDPTSSADTEQEDYTGTVHLSVWPTTRFVRGA